MYEVALPLFVVHICLAAFLIVRIIKANGHPQTSIAWIMTILALPILGSLFHIFNGARWNRRRLLRERAEDLLREQAAAPFARERFREASAGLPYSRKKFMSLASNIASALPLLYYKTEFFSDGTELFDRIIQDMERAERSIYIEYYIYKYDALGKRIEDILIRKVAEGVEVKILIDAVGSLFRVPFWTRYKWRRLGIGLAFSVDPREWLNAFLLNYRNHRKILVIDHKIAYTGSANIGEEYLGSSKRFPVWRDNHVRLEGEPVRVLEAVFVTDWNNTQAKRKHLNAPKLKPFENYSSYAEHNTTSAVAEFEVRQPLQVICSGPDSEWFANYQLYLNMIATAHTEILIQTPYWVPHETLIMALCAAAQAGVDVKLMITGMADKRLPFWTACSYMEDLLAAGVKIYRYTPGFLHAKNLVVDAGFYAKDGIGRGVASVGSCNFDMRSFFLDYELNLLSFDSEGLVKELAEQFVKDLERCEAFTYETFKQISPLKKFRNSCVRLLAPLL